MSLWADHPLLGGLFGDRDIAAILSTEQQIIQMRRFETSYLNALAHVERITPEQAKRIITQTQSVTLDMTALQNATTRDGIAVPGLVTQLKQGLSAEDATVFHNGLTSQDIIDTSLALQLSPIIVLLLERIDTLTKALDHLGAEHGHRNLMGRTRHQAALPITVQHRIDGWHAPLPQLSRDLKALRPSLLRLQLGGPVGLADGLDPDISTFMADDLGLTAPAKPWHTDRHALITFGGVLSQISGALGKIGQDIALMAQQGIGDITLSGSGGSSAMAHKENPILAETLITMARFNSAQIGGLHQALIHEQERSGVAWALEWMILPQMIETTGAGLSRAITLIQSVTRIGHD